MSAPLWDVKLAAWTHDPAEKALVLLHDPAGHEGGTVRALRKMLFPEGISAAVQQAVKRADHWAAAADRPQFGGGGRDAWAQVRFDQQPVLIHPLSGEEFDLKKLADIDPAHIKALSETHFEELVVPGDAKKTALNFWRFGPQLDQSTLPLLWQLLPADTRQPDHTIWAHLDLTSAFATAFTADALTPGPAPDGRGEKGDDAALLAMSFGPVQDFIAAAKSTSDLWAGSHLLSRIAWEGLKVIADEIGPDAVVFPQLRGVPQVDLWLRDEIGLPPERFAEADWAREKTDANPLFMAALPNKFVAIVPAGQATALAERVTVAVRAWVREQARAMLAELLDDSNETELPCHAQCDAQLAGFPEVHWAAVPFGLIGTDADGKALPEQEDLAAACRPFLGNVPRPGFLGSPAWKLLSREITVDGARIFTPNPGVFYPALYELLDRVAAAAKSVRPFTPLLGEGFRCDLSGEAEWLTTDRAQLLLPRGQRQDTLWTRAAVRFPGLFKKDEYLGALAMIKRMWPRRFADELRGLGIDVQRYVVSTHTLALAGALERWIAADAGRADLLSEAKTPSALPRRLMKQLVGKSPETRRLARCLPTWMDKQDENGAEDRAERRLASTDFMGSKPDAYYAILLMDGDRMGAWLSGTEDDYLLRYRDTFHPRIRAAAGERLPQDYLAALRPVSPARHMAISSALNDFALHLARHVVEDLCKGKLIYAGGDDVLAMVAVDDLMRCLLLLRLAYSGVWPDNDTPLVDLLKLHAERGMAQLKRGHALHGKHLLRLMGMKATASVGAVVAHHQTPLSRVLRELHATEQRAKTEGGRDAFSINLLKRSGGAVQLTLPWLTPGLGWQEALQGDLADTPAGLLLRLIDGFAQDTSRRAAYITQGWLEDLPTAQQIGADGLRELLGINLGRQLARQGNLAGTILGPKLAALACALEKAPADRLRDILAVAEFLAREGRRS